MTKSKHTPLIVNEKTPCTIITNDGRRISISWSSMDGNDDLEAERFAAFIVKCCNNHAALVEALETAIEQIKSSKEFNAPIKQSFEVKNLVENSLKKALAAAKGDA